ncbi:hypothetical protein GZH82_13760 [Staphylococcus ursi]|uniref:hypothetical protein n=1 Tax=Staphylococcus sp. MI 10-1553 TaxID=1912064 RepID=UPI001397D934|nr:hypothetical protein [Staphylococcus sp. MI 10-1553]QHW38305.1 hypothetical protein GZH82_13760 [Staphylococcus sp. MI 10-1553]
MTRKNNSFVDSLLGFIQDRDEREEQMVYEKMTNLFLSSFWILLLFLLISGTVDAYHNTITVGSFLLFTFSVFIISSILIILRKSGLDKEVVYSEEEYQSMLKKVRFRSALAFGLFLLLSLFFNILFKMIVYKELNFDHVNFLVWMIIGILYGLVSYYYAKSKITIEK